MSKVAQYATIDDKVFKDLGVINIKFTQSLFQAYITWPKKFGMLIILVLALQTFIDCVVVLMYCRIHLSFPFPLWIVGKWEK